MASLKGKQLNLLFQSIYAFGQRIPGFLPKTKFKLFGAVGCLHFSVSFSQALFLLAVISQLYFTTFWDLALKHLEMYLLGQYKKETATTTKLLEFWRTMIVIRYCTVNIFCASKNLFLHSYPGVSSANNILFDFLCPASMHLSDFSLIPLCLSSFLFFLLPCSLFLFWLPSSFVSFFCLFFFIQIWKPKEILWSPTFEKKGFFSGNKVYYFICTRFWMEWKETAKKTILLNKDGYYLYLNSLWF